MLPTLLMRFGASEIVDSTPEKSIKSESYFINLQLNMQRADKNPVQVKHCLTLSFAWHPWIPYGRASVSLLSLSFRFRHTVLISLHLCLCVLLLE